MFLSGLEIDFSSFKRKKTPGKKAPNPLLISLIVFVGILVLSYGLSVGFVTLGFIGDPYLMTIIIATISLGVVMPVLKGATNDRYAVWADAALNYRHL